MRSLKDPYRAAAAVADACKVVLDSSISDDSVRARFLTTCRGLPWKRLWKRSMR